MLSQSNINKLCINGLYRHKPDVAKVYGNDYANLYHCKNWTFMVYEHEGEYYMRDTYWGVSSEFQYKLTDENFDEFGFIFDTTKVQSTNCPKEYDEEDVYLHVATDSGGIRLAKDYVKKGAKRSKENLINICKENIRRCESNLSNYKRELEELENETHYKLNR